MTFSVNGIIQRAIEQAGDAPIGTTLRIRLPDDYAVSMRSLPDYVPELTCYDAMTDELIPVTQQWVNEAQQAMNRLHREREQLRAELDSLRSLRAASQSPEPISTPDPDRLWRTVLCAVGRG